MSAAPSVHPPSPIHRAARVAPDALARGALFQSFRETALAQWGKAGLAAMLPRLAPQSARALEEGVLAMEWRPEAILVDWYDALWAGPAREDEGELRTFVDRTIASGVGRTKRALLRLATPHAVATKAAEIWSDDHTHGSVVIERFPDSPRFLQGKLLRHPYLASRVMRSVMAETFRFNVAMTGAERVRAGHLLEGDVLTLKVSWEG